MATKSLPILVLFCVHCGIFSRVKWSIWAHIWCAVVVLFHYLKLILKNNYFENDIFCTFEQICLLHISSLSKYSVHIKHFLVDNSLVNVCWALNILHQIWKLTKNSIVQFRCSQPYRAKAKTKFSLMFATHSLIFFDCSLIFFAFAWWELTLSMNRLTLLSGVKLYK